MRSLLASALCLTTSSALNEFVVLQNAAQPGQKMPAVGLGTGGYGATLNKYGAYVSCSVPNASNAILVYIDEN